MPTTTNLPNVTTSKTDEAFSELIKTVFTPTVSAIAEPIKLLALTLGLPIKILHRHLSILDYKDNIFAQKGLNQFVQNVAKFPKENLLAVVPEIACKILPELPITASEEIRGLYITLLTKAANKATVHEVHPRFIWIIPQISEAEIIVLRYIGAQNEKIIPYLTFRMDSLVIPEATYLGEPHFQAELEDMIKPHNIKLIMENLSTLGIVKNMPERWPKNSKNIYDQIEENAVKKASHIGGVEKIKQEGNYRNPASIKNNYSLTEFGDLFLAAVDISKKIN